MERDKILEVSRVTKYFTRPELFRVLDDITFSVTRGEFATLVGKSGSGKSTLLYILSTMDTEYEGEVKIEGASMSGVKQNLLAALRNEKIGFVFQFHYLLPEFTCLKNVMIPALKLGRYSREEIESRAYDKLILLGLEDQALKPSSKLSGGQQQRVAIARALINDPLIIMGDEPTGNLDSRNTDIVFNTFQQLAHEFGQTIIAVSHDDDFARKSDRVIEMLDGRLV